MIELIAQALKFLVLVFQEIFSAVNAAKAQKQEVDVSNAHFQVILSKAIQRINQGKETLTKPEDDQVDQELKKLKDHAP